MKWIHKAFMSFGIVIPTMLNISCDSCNELKGGCRLEFHCLGGKFSTCGAEGVPSFNCNEISGCPNYNN